MSGPVLFTPGYYIPQTFNVPRQYCTHLVVNWAAQFVVSCGEEMVLQETLYGGYTAHLKLHHWFWANSSKTMKITDIFETMYVVPPGGGSPISAGFCRLNWEYDHNYHDLPVITFEMSGYDAHHYSYLPLPYPSSPYAPPYFLYSDVCHTAYYP